MRRVADPAWLNFETCLRFDVWPQASANYMDLRQGADAQSHSCHDQVRAKILQALRTHSRISNTKDLAGGQLRAAFAKGCFVEPEEVRGSKECAEAFHLPANVLRTTNQRENCVCVCVGVCVCARVP